MKRLSLALVAVLGVAGVEFFVPSSTAEASCVSCRGPRCAGTLHMGGIACDYVRGRCVTVGGCGYGPTYSLPGGGADREPGPVPRLAEAMDDREGDPTLRSTDACVPAPTAIATCSIANGQSSRAGCKSPWESGSRIRQIAPAERHLTAATAGP